MKLLLVIDMQNDFIDGSLGSDAAKAIVPAVTSRIENAADNESVIFTMDTHSQNYLETFEGGRLPVTHCVKGTSGWRISSDVMKAFETRYPTVNPVIIEKPTFGSEELLALIHNNRLNIDSVELIGLDLDICVLTNALMTRMALPDTPISVNVSCTAASSDEAFNATLTVLKSCQIDIIGAD